MVWYHWKFLEETIQLIQTIHNLAIY
ncbi:unnamed protein product [Spirodela intermedia]|uniref:Uncharacterized protein n=1 Tax=Spirodela intermedia TaxID=51605 RepID=A0A7I8IWG2_SPIIN|nr:unnamed protein product [Spirodela intermedia]CAA6661349.1 unnamed protein product [Spirodela intermedia]